MSSQNLLSHLNTNPNQIENRVGTLRPDASETSLGRLANPISPTFRTHTAELPVMTTHPQTGAGFQGRGVKGGLKCVGRQGG